MPRFVLCLLWSTATAILLSGCNNRNNSRSDGTPGDDPSVVTVKLTKDDYERAMGLKNRGVAHLENKEWADAEESLAALAELLPQNRLAALDLAVGRVFALVDRESPFTRSGSAQNAEKYHDAVRSAKDAIERFRHISSDKYDLALADLLMGKLLVHGDSAESPGIEQGLMLLKRAAQAEPEAADFQFAVALAMDGHRDYSDPDSPKAAELLTALKQSFKLAPQNLFALQKLLQRQALFLNSKDEQTRTLALQISETLEAAVTLLAPLNESIRKQRRIDLIDAISTSLNNADDSNPRALMQPAMMTANLLLPEVATQIDQRRLNRNLLEYLLLNFDDSFMASAKDAGAVPSQPPTVVTAFEVTERLPSIVGVDQAELLDMNLDGFDDLIVTRDGIVEVWSQGTDMAAEWQLLMKSPESTTSVERFLLADIDRDYDKAISDIKSPSLLRDADGDQKIVEDPAGRNRWYDTDADIIAWSDAGVVILRNTVSDDGQRRLVAVPQQQTLTDINDIAAADLEADGDLDLVFATDSGITLWTNTNGSDFVSSNDSASLPEGRVDALVIADVDRNLAIDIVGVTGADDDNPGRRGVLENILHGRFRWRPAEPDHPESPAITLQLNHAANRWDIADQHTMQVAHRVTQIAAADFDNDGYTDALCVAGSDSVIVRGTPDGFSDTDRLPELPVDIRRAAVADVDDDGDSDIVCVTGDDRALQVLTNNGGNSNNWIDVVARAVPDDPQFPSNRVNMHGVGSTIELRAGDLYHAEVIATPKVHLGLGRAKAADAVRIVWTDGIPQNVTVPNLLKPRIGILAPQILKGSCPYIYTWTGQQFEFFSDCLWAAPLGLMQASGELAPTREWENLLIPGEALAAKDEHYILQFTEELWETAYFDNVQLTAVDHPADVRIFTNEKVGPPELAAHRIHTVRNPRLPQSVVDARGSDLLPGLTALDGDYVQAFRGRVMQGLTDEWVMEFNLGQLKDPQNVRLFLTGWVFPTDTSLNLGIEQNPNLKPPVPPALEVPVGDGTWKTVRPFIGFPSGKTKAMVIDISDIFRSTDDYRFRIRSSMELYWDQAFFTVNETDADTVVTPCEIADGDLHYRGFSRRVYGQQSLFRNGRGPEGYDYQSVTTDPRWPPISGRFTRYGLVTPLLLNHDDQMVVMGPGDELTVRFIVPAEPVPKNWKRDFILTNIGYDKDADLNTIYGQSSEPFPFKAMSRYPFAPDDPVPDMLDNAMADKWQTRTYSQRTFWNVIREQNP